MQFNYSSIVCSGVAIPLLATLLSCGGGGGGGGSSGAAGTLPAPVPTVNLALSAAKTSVAKPVTLTWTSTDTTSCTGSDYLGATQTVNGSQTITPTEGGQFKYTLSCNGAGGMVKQSVTLVVPIPVMPTSYENAKVVNKAPPQSLTFMTDIGSGGMANIGSWNARAFADFEQTGTLSYFAHSLVYQPPRRDQFGKMYIYRINPDKTMTDISAQIIEGDRTGCLHPRKAIVADFNQDGRPDVFVACHGYDAMDRLPLEGDIPYIMLSQLNGKYKISQVSFPDNVAYIHGATAADLNGDGYPDIVVADHNANNRSKGESPVYLLINDKDGTFTRDQRNFAELAWHAVWSVEMADVDGSGKKSLWVSGHDPIDPTNGGAGSRIYNLIEPAKFSSATKDVKVMPQNDPWQTSLDIVFRNNLAYVLRVDAQYTGVAIQKVDLATGAASIVYTSKVDFGSLGKPECSGLGGPWFDWIRIVDNKIVTDDNCRSPNLPI